MNGRTFRILQTVHCSEYSRIFINCWKVALNNYEYFITVFKLVICMQAAVGPGPGQHRFCHTRNVHLGLHTEPQKLNSVFIMIKMN